jgi:hypothetical protein
MKKTLLAMVMLLGVASILRAQIPAVVTGTEKGWYKIGESSASFKKERESIVVMGKDEFASIKLRITDAPINIERLQVYFEGGKVQDIEVKKPMKPGEETPEYNLEADNKEINKVVYIYKTLDNDGGQTADVELYGFKAGPDKDSDAFRKNEENAEDAADEVKDEAREAGEKVDDRTQDVRNDVREESREVGERVEQGAENAGEQIEQGAQNVKEETSEAAQKVKAEIKDRELDDKEGPGGQTIYVDDNTNYYYIDESGNKIYISALELKDKK